MRDAFANPYRFDDGDQDHCAICREPITQPKRGPARIYCANSECRRAGAMNQKLADAWDAGYVAGRSGKPVVAALPVEKSRWATAYAKGAKEATEAVARTLQTLTVEIDMYSRNRSPERLKTVKRALAQTRAAVRMRKPSNETGARGR